MLDDAGVQNNRVIDAYSIEEWGDLPNFAGNFINFGYWKNIADKCTNTELTFLQRVESQKQLYLKVAKNLNITSKDILLEIGAGRGVGAVDIAKSFMPKKLIGIDITDAQVNRANLLHSKKLRTSLGVKFLNLSLESFKTLNIKPNKAYSIEVFQHIENISKAASLISDILPKSGSLVVATYFLTKKLARQDILKMFPLAASSQEFWHTQDDFCNAFAEHDFHINNVEAIGSDVFWGYDKWNKQQKIDTECSFVYNKYYNEGYIDYFIIDLKKSS